MKVAQALAAWLVAIAIALLPGCSAPPRGLVLWHPYRGDEESALRQSIARFEAAQGVSVTVLAVPYEAYLAKLEAAIPRGNGPDVFVGPHNRLGEYLRHRLVAPIGRALTDAETSRYEDVTVTAVTYDGVRYAVPLAQKSLALYTNPTLVPAPPKTLEALVRLKGTLDEGVWPLVYEAHSAYYHAALLHAFGGTLFDGSFAMVGEPAERSLVFVQKLVTEHVVPEQVSGDLVKTLFASGKAVAVLSGPWLAADLDASVRYDITPLPSLEGVGPMRPLLTVDGVFLTPGGASQSSAQELARSLGSLESARLRARIGKQVVATKAYWVEASAETNVQDARERYEQKVLEAFHKASASAVPMSASVAMNPVWVPAEQAIRKVLRGDVTPKAALDEAKARYAEVMRPPPPSPSPAPLVLVVGLGLLAVAFSIVKRVRAPGFSRQLRASVPAYAYVTHAALTVFVLVVLPLVAGAAMSFFAGVREEMTFVGLANYVDILTARGKPLLSNGSFYLTLLVTVAWTVVNVALHVALGLVLGVALARPALRLRAAYRVLLVVPWAVPSYVTALAWKGMFHRQFGAINALLAMVGVEPVSWFSKFSTAFTANVATNVWLGFPFMMVVVMGALTSISKDVLEAAEVDGASRAQAFRLVTLPLLGPTLLPAVVLGAVWTFNMFNVVFLVSGGEPDGSTDILVSEAYRWAFARNAQLGMAAAYAVIIFGLLALMSRLGTRFGSGEAREADKAKP
jgi:arabinogalactan oligomer/maltooligosaccharide transport system permease protein